MSEIVLAHFGHKGLICPNSATIFKITTFYVSTSFTSVACTTASFEQNAILIFNWAQIGIFGRFFSFFLFSWRLYYGFFATILGETAMLPFFGSVEIENKCKFVKTPPVLRNVSISVGGVWENAWLISPTVRTVLVFLADLNKIDPTPPVINRFHLRMVTSSSLPVVSAWAWHSSLSATILQATRLKRNHSSAPQTSKNRIRNRRGSIFVASVWIVVNHGMLVFSGINCFEKFVILSYFESYGNSNFSMMTESILKVFLIFYFQFEARRQRDRHVHFHSGHA